MHANYIDEVSHYIIPITMKRARQVPNLPRRSFSMIIVMLTYRKLPE